MYKITQTKQHKFRQVQCSEFFKISSFGHNELAYFKVVTHNVCWTRKWVLEVYS